MEIIDILFAIGNGLFLIASYPMIKAALKNKNSLKGFSFIGGLLTFLGMLTMITAFIYLQSYISVVLAIPTLLYWAIVAWYNR